VGLIQAIAGAVGGTLADQWKDFFTIPAGLAPTAAVFPAVQQDQNAGRGSDTRHSTGIISDGSTIVVPEGYGLLTFENGGVTSVVTQAGAYRWDSKDINSQSIFAGDGFWTPLFKQAWERFKFGGAPGSQQVALFVNLKEIPDNRFGTQSEIYWDDAYLNAQVGALTRGTYTIRITDPITFTKNFIPATYLQGGAVFDFTDLDNPAATQLFNEVVASLAPAFSLYTNDPTKGNRITRIQQDSLGFAQALAAAVEQAYHWKTDRGLEIVKTAIMSIEYDEHTRELLKTVQRADALAGARGNSNLEASVAAGFQAAGENAGVSGLFGMGVAAGGTGLGGIMQPQTPAPIPGVGPNSGAAAATAAPATAEDPFVRLGRLKEALDAGLITQADYDAAKAKALGL